MFVTSNLVVNFQSLFYNYGVVHFFLKILPSFGTSLVVLLSRFSRVQLCATPWTAARQAPPSLGLSGRERWSGCRFFLQIDGLLYTNADSLPNRFCNKEIEKRTQWGFKVSFP